MQAAPELYRDVVGGGARNPLTGALSAAGTDTGCAVVRIFSPIRPANHAKGRS